MEIKRFAEILNADFYTGVPDSQLKALCDYLMNTYGTDHNHHIIAANEGNCVAIAAGYHMATKKTPVVYMQNSGEGNIINPVASLLNEKVYGIPMIFVIGWRGQPGVHDEPQHIFQGQITTKILDVMGIDCFVIDSETTESALINKMEEYQTLLSEGKCVAFVIKKGALSYEQKADYANSNSMIREKIIEHIVAVSGEDSIVSTTGKISRELFEIRVRNNQDHKYDFLTVGSMGHASSIALGIAINKLDKKIWCIDGDGAAIMHMGAMSVIGKISPENLVHIVINNSAHETVGGMPTAADAVNFKDIAKACGYKHYASVDNYDELDSALKEFKETNELCFLEIKASIGSRKDLGRPTTAAIDNKKIFMDYLNE